MPKAKQCGIVKEYSIPKFVYPHKLAIDEGRLGNFAKEHFAAAQEEFYYEYKEALSNIKQNNKTRIDAAYLTFQGFQYETIHSGSALVLNFKYDTVLNEGDLQLESVMCIVLDKNNKRNVKVTGINQQGGLDWDPEDACLVWGMVTRVCKDLGNSRSCCVALISEITRLDPHKVLLKLTVTRKPILALTADKFFVHFHVLRDMGSLHCDLNEELVPVLLSNAEENTRPHYLVDVEVERNLENLNQSQIRAVDWCLNHKIAIVQGPPGTGKSYLALKLIKMLSSIEDMRPILFVTVKNAVLDNALQKLIDMQVFDKEKILRLGQRYDKTKKDIEEVSANSLHYQTLKDQARDYKSKNLQKVWKDLEVFYAKSTEVFVKVDDLRTMDVRELWDVLTEPQQKSFVKHAMEWHEGDFDGMPPIIQGQKIEYEEVERAFNRWLPDKVLQLYLKTQAQSTTRVEQIPDDRKQRQSREPEHEQQPSTETNYFRIADSEEHRTFRIDDFPETWVKMKKTHKVEQLWDLEPEERLRFIYSHMYKRLAHTLKELKAREVEHFNSNILRHKYKDARKGKILENYAVIATTVHGALIHKQALSKAGVVTVVCEEASQVSERELLVCLPTSTLHLIMIGDHQQLPPFCNIPTLTDKSQSLMSRMVSNNYPYTCLTEQFRMIPKIAELLRRTYPDLATRSTDERVLPNTYIRYPVYWWNHDDNYEYKGISPSNEPEAEKVCALARYLLLHGVEEKRITIITGYQGQVAAIRDILNRRVEQQRDPKKILNIQIRTIDSYQGSENDVILLSLTRHNPASAVGFMELAGRRCVALSRARLALYIVGSQTSYGNTDWKPVIDDLRVEGLLGDVLPLRNEEGKEKQVRSAGDLYRVCEREVCKGLGCWDD